MCRLLKLSLEQKCDIASRELDELREEVNKKCREKEKTLDNHKVMIEGGREGGREELHVHVYVDLKIKGERKGGRIGERRREEQEEKEEK